METISFARQITIFDPERFREVRVDVAGLGGVGGAIMMHLLKHGVRAVHGYDDDIVSNVNPPGQIYGSHDVGRAKTDALHDIVYRLSGSTFVKETSRVTPQTPFGDVVFLCIDHQMELRKKIVHSIFENAPQTKLLIETRVDANYVVIHTIVPSNKNHQEMWNHFWFPDSGAENNGGCAEPVALGVTSSCAAILAVSQMIQWFGNGERDLEVARGNQIRLRMRPFESEVHEW